MQLLDDYIAYFKNIAVNHLDLIHSDTEGQETFSAIYPEEMLGDFRNKMKHQAITLHALKYSFSITDPQCPMVNRLGGFIVMGYSKRGDFAGKSEMESTCERILLEIMIRIQADSKNGHPLFNGSQNRLTDVRAQPYSNKATGQYSGFVVTFPMITNIDFVHADVGWKDGGLTPLP